MFSHSFKLELNIKKESAKNMLEEIVSIDKNFLWSWGLFKSIRKPFKGYFEEDNFSIVLQEIYKSSTRLVLFGKFIENEDKTYLTIDMRINKFSNVFLKFFIGFLIFLDIIIILTNPNFTSLISLIVFNCPFGLIIYFFYFLFTKERDKSEKIIQELYREYIA